jgi:hypothetical protein
VNNAAKALVYTLFIFLLVSCSKSGKLFDVAKEEGVSSATGWGVDGVLKYVDLDYALSLVEENRVHSVKAGKGISIVISDLKSNVALYATPIDGVGVKKRLYENSQLFPGSYVITSNIGTSSLKVSLRKNTTFDFYKIANALQADASKGRGRLKLTVSPEDAKIVIYGTPHKYHEGLKLPEGQYDVKVSKPGYQAKNLTVSIAKNTLTSESITLQLADSLGSKKKNVDFNDRESGIERIAITGAAKENNSELQASAIPTGKLVILPQRNDIEYTITSVSGAQFTAKPSLELPVGNYYVTASRRGLGDVIARKQIRILSTEQNNVVFSIPALPYQNQLPVSLVFKSDLLGRQRAEINLVPNQGETISFRKRMGRRGLEIETVLLNGEYSAELTAGGIQYDLGSITIEENKSNKFEFVLK